ncbi:MAG: hypothetical protein SPL96_00045 [Bacteroidales bacterium]|nr:hypothetical protein [Bacteroidales bacterium]
MKIKNLLFFAAAASLSVSAFADDLATGEWAWLPTGEPAVIGQTTMDHLFVRGDYENTGSTVDNQLSFKLGGLQTVQVWLDDDEIYLNDKVQALTPIAINSAGDLYQEITYNSLQCEVYLPMSLRMVMTENEDGDEVAFEQGDRMPNTSDFAYQEKQSKVVDGKEYRVYGIVISNTKAIGCHFSSKNANLYKANGALKKDDAPLFSIFIQNDNQDQAEGRLDQDMIIANTEFGFREGVRDGWEPNDYRFIYGTGGNMESQRFQLYNRVAVWGSTSVVENLAEKTINNVKYINVAGMESNVPFDGVNIKVTTYNDGTTSTSKVMK